jgi:hypothetical protein
MIRKAVQGHVPTSSAHRRFKFSQSNSSCGALFARRSHRAFCSASVFAQAANSGSPQPSARAGSTTGGARVAADYCSVPPSFEPGSGSKKSARGWGAVPGCVCRSRAVGGISIGFAASQNDAFRTGLRRNSWNLRLAHSLSYLQHHGHSKGGRRPFMTCNPLTYGKTYAGR